MLSSLEILILSAIQGISEFLPVSSVAHLVLISKYYVFTNQNLLIDICLHLGSLLAIVFYFRNDDKNRFNTDYDISNINYKTLRKSFFISRIPGSFHIIKQKI